ncbi:MAG TPA: hypothetical protein VD813_05355 [Pseudonocardia sp.]|nr:hypothetical protein [Pseudonocardia sp.]
MTPHVELAPEVETPRRVQAVPWAEAPQRAKAAPRVEVPLRAEAPRRVEAVPWVEAPRRAEVPPRVEAVPRVEAPRRIPSPGRAEAVARVEAPPQVQVQAVPQAEQAPEPLRAARRARQAGTVAGIHPEQLLLWQLAGAGVVLLWDARPPVAAPAVAFAAAVLALTATRRRGRWTYRHLLHRYRSRRQGRAGGPRVTIRDTRLGRRRRLGTVFDGTGWSAVVRLAPAAEGTGAVPLGPVVGAVERFLADPEHDFAEVHVVHSLVPPGRTVRAATPAGPQDRDLPPVAAQTWITCRVHGVRAVRPDRPIPDLQAVRRDLRRAVDAIAADLVEHEIDAVPLTARQLHADCLFSAGGRAGGVEPVAVPDEPAPDPTQRRPAAARPGARAADERPVECEAVTVDPRTDLGDAVHGVHVLHRWPGQGFTAWTASLARVPARVLTLAISLGRAVDGTVESTVVVRHTTGGPDEAERVDADLVEGARAVGAELRRLAVDPGAAVLGTLPLGTAALQREPAVRHVVEPEPHAGGGTGPSGLVIGHDPSGAPVALPLLGPDPAWLAVLGGPEAAAALAAAALVADVQVLVVSPERHRWGSIFARFPHTARLEVLEPGGEAAVPAVPPVSSAVPALHVLDAHGPEMPRPVLRPWQAGVCRIEPGQPDLRSLLRGVTRVLATRCSAEQAAAVCAAVGLDEREAARLTCVPEGTLAIADRSGVHPVELDTGLLARLGITVGTRSAARDLPVTHPSASMHRLPMMAG